MDNVRKRLAEYRRLKQQQTSSDPGARDREGREEDENGAEKLTREPPGDQAHPSTLDPPQDASTNQNNTSPPTPLYMTLLKVAFWSLLWGFFIEVGFGAVFFITSLLYFIIVSLRGSRRKPWEPSAYSVFNENFETIDGTLTAEQFERELRYGPLNIKR